MRNICDSIIKEFKSLQISYFRTDAWLSAQTLSSGSHLKWEGKNGGLRAKWFKYLSGKIKFECEICPSLIYTLWPKNVPGLTSCNLAKI